MENEAPETKPKDAADAMPGVVTQDEFQDRREWLRDRGVPVSIVNDFFNPNVKFDRTRADNGQNAWFREALSEDPEIERDVWNRKKYQRDEEIKRKLQKLFPFSDPEQRKRADAGIDEYLAEVKKEFQTGNKEIDDLQAKLDASLNKNQEYEEQKIPELEKEAERRAQDVHVRYNFIEQLRPYNLSRERVDKIMKNFIRDAHEAGAFLVLDEDEPNGIKMVDEKGNPFRPNSASQPWKFRTKLDEELVFLNIINTEGEILDNKRTAPDEPSNAAPTYHGARSNMQGVNTGQPNQGANRQALNPGVPDNPNLRKAEENLKAQQEASRNKHRPGN